MDPRAALRDAIIGGTQIGASTNSPIGNYPEIQALYAPQFAQSAAAPAARAAGNYDDITERNRLAAEEDARQNHLADLKAKLAAAQDQQDPSKYQRVAREDGGYGFYDPTGKEISAFEYSRITGKKPDEVLKGSLNPIDHSFQEDYKQFNQYFKDKQQSNPKSANYNQKAAARAAATEQRVKDAWGVDLHKADIRQLWNTFQQAYPTVFGLHTKGPQGTGQYFPSNQALDEQQLGLSSVQSKKKKSTYSSGGGGIGR